MVKEEFKLAMALSGMYIHICIMYMCGVSRMLRKMGIGWKRKAGTMENT